MTAAKPTDALRLISVSFSHYCEKARWALDRSGLPYREEAHVPVLSWRATYGAGGGRTVPCLITPGAVVPDSTDILRWLDARHGVSPLFPEGNADAAQLEELFDRKVGPAARRIAYFHLLDRPELVRRFIVTGVPGWEATAGRLFFPILRTIIIRGLRISVEGAERSRQSLDRIFGEMGARLSDGRRYLTGDTFTAADLTFAALASPVLLPDALSALYPPREELPQSLIASVDGYRAAPAGKFAMRLYEEERSSSNPLLAPSTARESAASRSAEDARGQA